MPLFFYFKQLDGKLYQNRKQGEYGEFFILSYVY